MALEKRFFEYETMWELLGNMEEDFMALTLWKRVLYCIKRLLEVLCEHLGVPLTNRKRAWLMMTKLPPLILSWLKHRKIENKRKMLHETLFNCYLAITCEFEIEENDYLPITLQSSIVRLSSEKLIPTNTFPRLSSAKAAAYFLFSIWAMAVSASLPYFNSKM